MSFSLFFSTGLESFATASKLSFASYRPTVVIKQNAFCVDSCPLSITLILLSDESTYVGFEE